MQKKFLSFFLLVVTLFSISSTGMLCLAESNGLVEADLVLNGGMEWMNTSYQCWSGSHTPETEIVHSGNKSLKITVDASRPIYTQNGTGVTAGQTYTLSYWIYAEASLEKTYILNGSLQAAGAGAKIEISGTMVDSSGNSTTTTIASTIDLYNPTGDELGTWVQRTITVTVPENGYTDKKGYTYYPSGTFTLHIRPQGTGTVWYDDMTLTGYTTQEKADYVNNKRSSYQEGYELSMSFFNVQEGYTKYADLEPGVVNFVKNPNFETADAYYNDTDEEFSYKKDGTTHYASGAASWSRSNYGRQQDSDGKEIVSRTSAENRTEGGGYSMRVTVPENYTADNAPMFMQTLYPNDTNGGFVAGAEYIFSCWVKTKDVTYGEGVFYKLQANYDGGNYVFSNRSVAVYGADEWTEVKYVFTMPENITSIHIYIRLSGSGTFYCDDVVFGRSSNNNPLDFYTEHTFYYTEDDNIDATAKIKTNLFEIEDGSTITFRIEDESGNTVGEQILDAAETVSVTFPVSTLTKLKTKYILNVEYKNPDGDIISSATKRIYRYNRPTAINEDGNYVDENTDKEIYPHFMYGQRLTTNDDLAAGGVTIVRPSFDLGNDASIQATLDDLHAHGMKALINLYGTAAGHPTQIERTRAVVSKFHTHPAVAAWMLMDEPSLQVRTGGILTYDEMLYWLEEGYKAVREIDDVHPVYNIETTGAADDSYERTGQMCDIFAIDPYPSSLQASISGSLVKATQRARNAVYDERPVWVLGLAAEWSGSYATPTVNSAMLRFQIYDALWAGAKGAGHYLGSTEEEVEAVGGKSHLVTETVNAPIYNKTMKQASESGEIKELFEHFSLGKHTVFTEGTGNGYRYRIWYKDNGDMYMAVTSQIAKDEKNEDVMLDSLVTDIKLVSPNGNVSIDGFDAELVNGISEKEIHSSDNTFAMTLSVGEASLYKITPAENINFPMTDTPHGEKRPMDYGTELVSGGDFENGLGSFFTAYNVGKVLSSANSGNGESCLQLVPSGSDNVIYRSKNISVASKKTYELSFMMKTSSLTSATLVPNVKLKFGSGSKIHHLYNIHPHNGEWKTYKKVFEVPEDMLACKIEFELPAACGDVFLDDISLRQVTAYNEEQFTNNNSFEWFEANASYINANGTKPINWDTSSKTYANIYVADDSVIAPHSGNYSVGIKAAVLQQTAPDVEYGKTYEFSVWFNAKNMVDKSTYPHLTIQTRNSAGAYANGATTKREYFYDSYLNKDKGWYKLTALYTVPEYQDGYDIKSVVVTLNVAGDAIGYFDDASFKLVSEKGGYTLRNLKTTVGESSITVEYDVTNHFTEYGGTVIYAFYDADGRFIKFEKETASFDSLHITKTFDKVDFANVKVFVWDSLGGLVPYSNMIE